MSTTLGLRPETTAASIRVLVTPANVRTLDERLGTYAPATGLPWTMRDIIARSKREFSIHITSDGQISITVDTPLPEEDAAALSAFGFSAITADAVTVIVPDGLPTGETGPSFRAGALLPTYDGDLHIFGEETASAPLRITGGGVSIVGMGIAEDGIASGLFAPNGAAVLAKLAIPAGFHDVPMMWESLLPVAATAKALDTLLANGGALLVTEDRDGLGYFLSFPPGDLTVEELASLGKDIMNRQTLTTQAWTTEDGEAFTEIRSATEDIAIDIRAEEAFTLISLSNTTGNLIRLAKTPNLLTLANRDISLENTEKVQSECMYRAHSWFKTSVLPHAEVAGLLNTNHTLVTFLRNFEEVAINVSKITLCW